MTKAMAEARRINELAHKIFWEAKAKADQTQREYDEEAREWAEQGYRPERCIHGTYMWVEWDCACGACELGEPLWDDARDWAYAKDHAAGIWEVTDHRLQLYIEIAATDQRNDEMLAPLWKWVFQKIQPYL